MSMTRDQVMDLGYNQSVYYAGFTDLRYKGKDEKHVILEDKHGDTRKYYIELFMKYGKSL